MITIQNVPAAVARKIPGGTVDFDEFLTVYFSVSANQENQLIEKLEKIEAEGDFEVVENLDEMLKW